MAKNRKDAKQSRKRSLASSFSSATHTPPVDQEREQPFSAFEGVDPAIPSSRASSRSNTPTPAGIGNDLRRRSEVFPHDVMIDDGSMSLFARDRLNSPRTRRGINVMSFFSGAITVLAYVVGVEAAALSTPLVIVLGGGGMLLGRFVLSSGGRRILVVERIERSVGEILNPREIATNFGRLLEAYSHSSRYATPITPHAAVARANLQNLGVDVLAIGSAGVVYISFSLTAAFLSFMGLAILGHAYVRATGLSSADRIASHTRLGDITSDIGVLLQQSIGFCLRVISFRALRGAGVVGSSGGITDTAVNAAIIADIGSNAGSLLQTIARIRDDVIGTTVQSDDENPEEHAPDGGIVEVVMQGVRNPLTLATRVGRIVTYSALMLVIEIVVCVGIVFGLKLSTTIPGYAYSGGMVLIGINGAASWYCFDYLEKARKFLSRVFCCSRKHQVTNEPTHEAHDGVAIHINEDTGNILPRWREPVEERDGTRSVSMMLNIRDLAAHEMPMIGVTSPSPPKRHATEIFTRGGEGASDGEGEMVDEVEDRGEAGDSGLPSSANDAEHHEDIEYYQDDEVVRNGKSVDLDKLSHDLFLSAVGKAREEMERKMEEKRKEDMPPSFEEIENARIITANSLPACAIERSHSITSVTENNIGPCVEVEKVNSTEDEQYNPFGDFDHYTKVVVIGGSNAAYADHMIFAKPQAFAY